MYPIHVFFVNWWFWSFYLSHVLRKTRNIEVGAFDRFAAWTCIGHLSLFNREDNFDQNWGKRLRPLYALREALLDEAQRIMVIIQRSLGLLDKELDEYQMKQRMLVPQYHENFMFLYACLSLVLFYLFTFIVLFCNRRPLRVWIALLASSIRW